MNLGELISLTQEHLDNPAGDLWSPSRVTTVINEAYEDVAGFVDDASKEFNVYQYPILLAIRSLTFDEEVISTSTGVISLQSTTKTPREWALAPTTGRKAIRRVLDVERYDGGRTISMDLIGWQQRNKQVDHVGALPLINPRIERVYAFRTDAGQWMLGFENEIPQAMTLKVWYAPVLERLTTSDHVPTQVPIEFHSLIAIRAALIGKQQEQRDPGWLVKRHEDKLMSLRNSLTSVVSTNRCTPWR